MRLRVLLGLTFLVAGLVLITSSVTFALLTPADFTVKKVSVPCYDTQGSIIIGQSCSRESYSSETEELLAGVALSVFFGFMIMIIGLGHVLTLRGEDNLSGGEVNG